MMCAFMTPVLKNDWEVYKTNRSRNSSESSSISASSNQRSRPTHVKRRGIGETGRSYSYHAPAHGRSDIVYVGSPPRAYHLSTKNSRYASRSSMDPISASTISPPKSPNGTVKGVGPTKSPSSASLSRFHNKKVRVGRWWSRVRAAAALLDECKSTVRIPSSPPG